MSTTNQHLISFRTNTKFSVNYETMNLVPQLELILITVQPKYTSNKKGDVVKGSDVGEFRIHTTLEGINQMIGELQVLAARLQTYEQVAVGLNMVIAEGLKRNPPEKK